MSLLFPRLPADDTAGAGEHRPQHALEEQGPGRCHQVSGRFLQGLVARTRGLISKVQSPALFAIENLTC